MTGLKVHTGNKFTHVTYQVDNISKHEKFKSKESACKFAYKVNSALQADFLQVTSLKNYRQIRTKFYTSVSL